LIYLKLLNNSFPTNTLKTFPFHFKILQITMCGNLCSTWNMSYLILLIHKTVLTYLVIYVYLNIYIFQYLFLNSYFSFPQIYQKLPDVEILCFTWNMSYFNWLIHNSLLIYLKLLNNSFPTNTLKKTFISSQNSAIFFNLSSVEISCSTWNMSYLI